MTNDKSLTKNILFISSLQIFPAQSGGQLRSSNICSALAKQGHKVSVYSFTGRKDGYLNSFNDQNNIISSNLSEFVSYNRFFGLLQFISYRINLPPIWLTLILLFYIPKKLKQILSENDLVILDFPFLYPLSRRSFHKFLLNTHNAEFSFYDSKLLSKLFIKPIVKAIEAQAFTKIENVIFCSKLDLDTFISHKIVPITPVLLPNGVQVDLFNKNHLIRTKMRAYFNISDDIKVILFTGSHFGPNSEAYNFLVNFVDTHQELLDQFGFVFLIVGTVSPKAFSSTNLIVTGKVDIIHDYFHMSDLAINPIISGSGTNVKMMEYLAAKLPIITTHFGARGLNLVDKENCFLFDYHNLSNLLREIFTDYDKFNLQRIANLAYKDNHNTFDMGKAIKVLNIT